MKCILIDITESRTEELLRNHYLVMKIIKIEETTEDNELKKQAKFLLETFDPEEWPRLLKLQQLTHVLIVKNRMHGGVWIFYFQSALIIDILFAHNINKLFYSFIQDFLEKDLLMNIIVKDYKEYITDDDNKFQDILKGFPVYNKHNYIHSIEYQESNLLKNIGFSTLIRLRFQVDLDFPDKRP